MEELSTLLLLLQEEHKKITKKWLCDNNYYPLNMKKIKVEDVYNNEMYLIHIFNYRTFINDNISDMVKKIQEQHFNNVVNTRVKAVNSIQYKIQNYMRNHENGKIPLKKCINDILGIRIIFDDIDYQEIKEFIKLNYPSLKCIKSIKKKYNAIHIYFGNDNNINFQWELQIWNKKYEKTNLDSHAMYKQDYTKWEQENI